MKGKERPMFRAAMFVAVQNEVGEYLLQRRASTGFLDGYYDLASGHLEYGESCEECAVREAYEEYGIKIQPADLELAAMFQSDFEPNAGIRYLNYIYKTGKFMGEPTIGEPDKIDYLGWYAPEQFPENLTIGARIFLRSIGSADVRNYYIDAEQYNAIMGNFFE